MSPKKQQIDDQTIFTGDNLDIMRGMDSESVDLIYLDPPFNSNRHYEAPIGSKAAGAEFKDAWTFEDTKEAWWGLIADEHPAIYKVIDAAGDVGNEGDKAYLIYMAMRLLEMHRILKSTGSVYLHCDPTMSHGLKMVMDAIFGRKNFKNEIIWSYKRWGTKSKKKLNSTHDILFWYSKGGDIAFNYPMLPNTNPNPSQYVSAKNEEGKTVVKLDKDGKPIKREIAKEIPASDVWDLPIISPASKERTGYPTQKPLALLERIITASSNAGDVVLDPFCGCATACLAAHYLGRKWIGIDISPLAATLIEQRLESKLSLIIKVNHRKDIPIRSDHLTPPSKDINHTLFGRQEGKCNGCGHSFPFQNFTRDHIIPTTKGGANTDDNLQLLCGRCNSIKGIRPMEYLVAKLTDEGTIQKPVKRR